MITAIVGTVEDEQGLLRGNGKTNVMTYYGRREYLADKAVYSNYKTLFSKQITMQKMMDMIIHDDLRNVVLLIDEIQIMLNSLGAKHTVVKFVDKAIAQTRKKGVDILYTSQRFWNVHARLRQQTDVVIKPKKYHYDFSECMLDRCNKRHIIAIYMVQPVRYNPIQWIRPEIVGKWYDSNEVIDEDIKL